MTFLNSILNQSKKHNFPFDHWEYNNALTDEAIEEIVKASENNSLKEMFGSGTAVVINPIKSFGYKGINYKLPELENPLSTQLKDKIMSIQYNLSEDPYGWRVAVD